MSIAVIGAGYVGLTTAACLAHLGHEVVCADIDAERVARLRKGEVPILEDGLPALITEGLASQRLSFVVGAAAAARGADIVFLCVQTPQGDDGAADLSLRRARRPGDRAGARAAAPSSSTSRRCRSARPGSCSACSPRPARRSEHVTVASNPEFLREGQAVHDFLHPDRIVIGCEDPESAVRVSRAVPRRARAGARHRPRVGRDDQVRVERVPRDQDLVHQRDREPVRGGRRRRARGRDRHGLRRAHRLPVPAPRSRATAGRASRRTSPRCCYTRARGRATTSSCSTVSSRSTAASTSASSTRSRAAAGGALDRRRRSRSGASRSRPTPTTCATRRRS